MKCPGYVMNGNHQQKKSVWEVLPKRWIVERSLAWINNSRRLSKDYEISVCSA